VRPLIETHPLDEAGAAYDRMMAGGAPFRMILTLSGATPLVDTPRTVGREEQA
jgi:hypothetical protein